MKAFRITRWAEHFETAENKKLKRLTWVALPTKQEGDGYTFLMGEHENGCAHFGAWIALVQLASKCSERGTFIRELGSRQTPHTSLSLSRITRVPIDVLNEAIPRLLEIGWLEEFEYQEVIESPGKTSGQDGKTSGQDVLPVVTGEERGEQDRTSQERERTPIEPPPQASPVIAFPSSKPEEDTQGKAAKNRERLLAILRREQVTMNLGSDRLFDEWVSHVSGYRIGWIEYVFSTTKPKIKLPSDLRKALKKTHSDYADWKERNPSKETA